MPINDCPLCALAALAVREFSGDHSIACTRCGYFALTDCARALVESLPSAQRTALTRAVQDISEKGGRARITVQNVAQLVAPYL